MIFWKPPKKDLKDLLHAYFYFMSTNAYVILDFA